MKKIVAAMLLALLIFTFFYYKKNPLGTTATINKKAFKIELAVTPAEKQKGLGYRDSLNKDAGMLFVYDHKERYGFWMKGMRFPLDFIWIDDEKVVDITENVPAPKTESERPVMLQPSVGVDKVLEVNVGAVQKYGIKIGDAVSFKN